MTKQFNLKKLAVFAPLSVFVVSLLMIFMKLLGSTIALQILDNSAKKMNYPDEYLNSYAYILDKTIASNGGDLIGLIFSLIIGFAIVMILYTFFFSKVEKTVKKLCFISVFIVASASFVSYILIEIASYLMVIMTNYWKMSYSQSYTIKVTLTAFFIILTCVISFIVTKRQLFKIFETKEKENEE